MKIPFSLANGFGKEFESWIADYSVQAGLLPNSESLHSVRYLSRSIVPHIQKLSSLFNRIESPEQGLQPYWKESSNPAHLRLAYFLYFMPANLFRTAAVWSELAKFGFEWANLPLKGVEFGAGPASGISGIAAGEHFCKTGLPPAGNWALIEQDKAVLDLGNNWAQKYFAHMGFPDWGTRPFHRKIDLLKEGFLPKAAPKFTVWLMSFYLNELTLEASQLAPLLIESWERHLEEEGIAILIEPALKLQSRRLLELRKELLRIKPNWLQLLLPCLGHQACGALSEEDDWCHEEATWWRPPYVQTLDRLAGLDRRTLPFSYLVLTKSRRTREEILPKLKGFQSPGHSEHHRLVSPAHKEGKEWEFFLCGEEGKQRARYRPTGKEDPAAKLHRGDVFLGAEVRGDRNSARVGGYRQVVSGDPTPEEAQETGQE